MPIRPEYRRFYRADWRRLRLELLERAGNRCEACHAPHRMLNVAHLSHDPADRLRLAVLCPSCHSRNDTPRRLAVTRRTLALRRGQLWLSRDMELAVVPLRLLPLDLRQMSLFGGEDLTIDGWPGLIAPPLLRPGQGSLQAQAL
jgi:hypothetical protein